jgi:citrate synthase
MYYLTAQQAAGRLGVTKATLYAYTSRGQLRSEPAPGQPRERRYHREDIERLRERKETRRDPARAAARSLDWGSPVLDSGITLIQNGRLYYRGRDALRLAETVRLEQVATLIWGAELAEQLLVMPPGRWARLGAQHPFSLMQAALPLAGAKDLESYDLRPEAVRRTGARILRLLTAIAAGRDTRGPIHEALGSAWAPKKRTASEAIRAALVLCADHELNVSTFAARCAASAPRPQYRPSPQKFSKNPVASWLLP